MTQPKDFYRPSRHGMLLGMTLAKLAEAGRRGFPGKLDDCCLTCAFRPGTLPNQSAGTGKAAFDCVIGLDKDRFACHHGMKDGEPSKICAGYVAARLAPWSLTKEIVTALHAALEEIDDTPDNIRAEFDAWLERSGSDPSDIYALARAYAKDHAYG